MLDWKKQYFEVVPHETKQRKEMKWISTADRLPDQREFIESYVRSAYAAEFLVTIEGAEKATTLYYSQTGVWFNEQGDLYKVIAWMPLPAVYKRFCLEVAQEQEDIAQERYLAEWKRKAMRKRER